MNTGSATVKSTRAVGPKRTAPANAIHPGGATQMDSRLTHERIQALAYQLWQERGSPTGSADEDWYRAEQEVRARYAGEEALWAD
jgi:hypothetical protein